MPRENLTTNACTVCRKKRTKCDGRHPCRRCMSRGEECVYEDKMWRTKDHLRSEIEKLRKEVHQSHCLIKALSPQGASDEWETIESRMQRGDPPERIAEWIKSLRSLQSPVQDAPYELKMQRTPSVIFSEDIIDGSYSRTVSPTMTRDSSAPIKDTSSYPRSVHTSDTTASAPARSWTQVTQDTEVIYRLIYHYFNHCFPDFSFICKERFMRDFNEGAEWYCSPALVNAILGYTAQTRSVIAFDGSQPCTSNQFLCEANRLLREEEDHLEMTSIQALGVLALAEVNMGNDESAYQLSVECARSTILYKVKLDREDEDDVMEDSDYREAMAATFCGALSLIRMFRTLTGRLATHTAPLFMRLTHEPNHAATETPEARVERGVALQHWFFRQLELCPGPTRLVFSSTEIAHTFCCYHHDGGVTPVDLIPAYNKCLAVWRTFNAWLPSGNETNQDVLFAQIWYNYNLLILFTTLIDDTVDLYQGITPRAMVIQASQTIILLTARYQEHCGFESIHPLLPHMVFAAARFHFRTAFSGDDHHRQFSATMGGDRRNRFSETQSPSPIDIPSSSSPATNPRYRSSSIATNPESLVYPPLEDHMAAATIRHIAPSTGTEAYALWSTKSSLRLAKDGARLLAQMGAKCPTAGELAQKLRIRSVSGLATTVKSSLEKPVMPTPSSSWPPAVMESTVMGWTPTAPEGLSGLGMDDLAESVGPPTAGSSMDSNMAVDGIPPGGGMVGGGSVGSLSETSGDVAPYYNVPYACPPSAYHTGSGSVCDGFFPCGASPMGGIGTYSAT